jgi:hypothetical protein
MFRVISIAAKATLKNADGYISGIRMLSRTSEEILK